MKKSFYADTPEIKYMETDMAEQVANLCRFDCHIHIVCTDGTAVISTGIQNYIMRRGTGLLFCSEEELCTLWNPRLISW